MAQDCSGILNDHSLEIVGKSYLGETNGATWGATDSVITRIKSGWTKSRDLVPLLASRGLPLGAKGRLESTCV